MKRVARAGVGAALLVIAAASVAATGGPGSAHEVTGGTSHVAGVVAAKDASKDAAPKLRVLLAGDSITQGFNGDYTWRFRLWQEFRRQQVAVDFVGSRHLPYVQEGFDTASYADPHFDTDHFAITGTLLSSLAVRIRGEVARERPDVMVLEAGVNDLLHGRTPQQTDAALRQAIAQARQANPALKIVVCPVLAVRRSQPTDIRENIRAYDALARATVAELTTPSSPVVLAHTRDGWDVENDTYAGLHPNPSGEVLIADQVAQALVGLGLLPDRPGAARAAVWHRDLQPLVSITDGRAQVSWDTQALSAARLRWRAVGGTWREVPDLLTDGRFATRLLTPGSYEFQLQAVRKRMVAPYGPVSRLEIPGA